MRNLEQHFLSDAAALDWIAAELDPRPAEPIVELGAGAGTVATALLQRASASDLTLVELDAALADALRRKFPGARVIEADWRDAWGRIDRVGALVVSLPDAFAQEVLDALAGAPPRVTVLAVAAGRSLRLPAGLRRTALRPLPTEAFAPPQPFAGEAWVLRPAGAPAR
jgi:16S rRNA A1518/A1519 N6-dimethyltransferase RsmA/KsgA/DIM1 with predicted DNA glycosylase/AP lyase activity